ncbi:MAG: aldo/keto reductase [Elusimicrobia bacterium]|nr:aldo/keto reductase [Elusimicrobiota bacterium]
MKLNSLGRSAVKVSALALGTMNFGADWHGVGALDEREARNLLDMALDFGVNLIDTADIYGRGASESTLGRILGPRRSRVLLATKVLGEMRPGDPSSGGLSRRRILEALEESLARLRTDYVDLYMPHAWDLEVPIEESLEAFEILRRQGKVRVLGCSNFSGPQLGRCLAPAAERGWARFEFDQVQYSLASRFIEEDLLPACLENEVGILAWSPLGGGLLSGKYHGGPRPEGRRRDPDAAFPRLAEGRLEGLVAVLKQVARLETLTPAQAALGWLMSRPGVASAVVGARTSKQLKENLQARPLSAQSLAFLEKASRLCSAH